MIQSDRGSNFIGLKGEMTNVPDFFDTGRIEEAFAPPEYNIDWRFNAPRDPSAGGAWERLIGLMKRALPQTLCERNPTEPVLRSALLEAMNIVNSRPLSDVPVHPEDGVPMTPNHIIIGHTNSTQTPSPPRRPTGMLKESLAKGSTDEKPFLEILANRSASFDDRTRQVA